MLGKYIQAYKHCIILSLTFAIVVSIFQVKGDGVSAESSLAVQEIKDPYGDWINMQSKQEGELQGDNATDITSVQSSANIDFLNATLWLHDRFDPKPNYSKVNYGMLIDSDFDKSTGFGGIDHQLEISWNNISGVWNYALKRWSPTSLYPRTIEAMHNYTGFFERGAEEYSVVLSLNLDLVGSPSKYKVVYYAEAVRDNDSLIDFTTWVPIPKMHMLITTSPNSIELRKGEIKTIEVNLNSSQGYEPTVEISAESNLNNVQFEFQQNDTIKIPTHGMATIPLTITALDDANMGTYTLRIFAESKLDPEEQIDLSSKSNLLDAIAMTSQEGVTTQTSVLVTVLEHLTWIDQVGDLWNKIGSPITFIYGILAGISPWIYERVKNQINNNKKKNKSEPE